VGGYEVDPAQLAASGKSVGAQGDALVAALAGVESALSGAGLMCGTDEAGLAFFLDYRKGSQAVVSAAESSVNAFRNVGYGVEVSAHNYACSEAASTIGGGRESIPVPAQPARYTASSMSGQSGPTVPQPGLWSVVQQFVGGSWPNGNPATMRAAADAWRALGTAISAASGEAAGCRAGMAGHDIPELVHITAALTTLTKATHDLGGQCQSLAASLDSFAGEVQSCQDAIRDLLHRLSVSGILEELGAIFSGHNPLDDLKQIGHDISAILHTLSRELDAFASAFQLLIDGMDGVIREFEVWDRKEFTHFFGDQVGNAMASGLNSYLDIEGGVAKSGLEVLQSVPTMLAHPVDTAKGMVTMGKDMAEVFTPLGLVDPKGAAAAGEHLANVAKGVVDYKDWSSDRPLVGLGDNLGNIAQVLIPGVGEAKAGLTAGKVGEEGAQVARAEGTVARGGLEVLGETGGRQIAGQAGKIGKDLDGLSVKPAEVPKVADPAPGARPADAGAAAGSNGAGKAPVDATARPVTAEPASAASGTAEPAPAGTGLHNGEGDARRSSAPLHPSTADTGGAVAHEAPAPRETAEAHSGSGYEAGHAEAGGGGSGGEHGSGDHGGDPHDGSGRGADDGFGHAGEGDSPYETGGNSSAGSDQSAGGDAAVHGDLEIPGDRQDPVHSHDPSGDGWQRLDDKPDNPQYGEPLEDHWSGDRYPDPNEIAPEIRELVEDPEAPYGRDAGGTPLSKEEHEQRYNQIGPNEERWDHYPPNDGAVPGTRVQYDSANAFVRDYGFGSDRSVEFDRIGGENGKYLGLMPDGIPASFEARGLPISSLTKDYFRYSFTGYLPDRWHIEISEIASAFAREGGGLQVLVTNERGIVMTIEDLLDKGILS